MALKVYNTLTNQKEEFEPIQDKKVRMYVCGQTVYDYMHIGHGKTYIAFDIIKRYLEYKGYDVELVINITDVNDKILNRANEEGVDYWKVAEKYARINLEDFEDLKVQADVYPRASEYIQEMVQVIKKLVEKGYAYEVEGDVFFDVREFDEYGKLSNQKLGDISSDRDDIIASQKKKHPEDFVLWRKKDVEPNWDSPWGSGWPGWHIECSTMSMRTLAETLDIHGGGSDLIFPHHEDEIAQSEAYSGEKFSNYWMHSGLVDLKQEKMSKSKGNIISTRKLLDSWEPEVLRLMVASSHYRKEMSFSEEKLEESKKKLETLRNTGSDLEARIRDSEKIPKKYGDEDLDTLERMHDLKENFEEAMDDDFNTPEALKQLLELSSTMQAYLDLENPKRPVLKKGLTRMRQLGGVFGVLEQEKREVSTEVQQLLDLFVEIRNQLRGKDEYELTDELRERLEEIGIKLEDEGGETVWKRVE